MTAYNGQEALDQIRREGRPCLVVLDLIMPVMDGLQFLEHREHDPGLASIPVVVVTATDQRAVGVHTVIRKPVNFLELLQHIESVCGSVAR